MESCREPEASMAGKSMKGKAKYKGGKKKAA